MYSNNVVMLVNLFCIAIDFFRSRHMNYNDLAHVGEDIAASVNNSIRTGDFSHLSSDITGITTRFTNQITDEFKGNPNQHAYGDPVHRYGNTSYSYENQRQYERNVSGVNGQGNGQQQYGNPQQPGWTAGTPNPGRQQYGGMTQQYHGRPVYAADYRNHYPSTFNMSKARRGASIAEIIFGIFGSAVFGIAFISTLVSAVVLAGSAAFIAAAGALGTLTVLSITGIVHGSGRNTLASSAGEMVRMIGPRTYVPIDEIARRSGKSHEQVIKELKKLINKGIIPQGNIDDNQTTLMLTDEMYNQYRNTMEEKTRSENEQKEREEQDKKNYSGLSTEVRNIIDEGNKYIQQIHEYNDRIPDEVMSEKLSKLESIMKRIFEQVEKKPESAGELQKFMEYYLPTTTKLISAYIDVSEQPVDGQNISDTKHQIEDTLDVINQAFEKLLDSMFEDMNWDIHSDISVMKTMLAQDGLTDNNDFDEKKQQ